ncbi:tetratricopeptide repeat protein [Actinomadura sp. 9N215]|uniref:tetratricopeptide repeat protein n=1 Tax=Actinomadura sp. 9N215 TaxID=3375150 RepID=UPI0037A09847
MERYRDYEARGREAVAAGRLDLAVAAYRAAVRLRPGHVPTQLALAGVLREAGLIEAARQTYERVCRLDPGNANASAALRTFPSRPAGRENFHVGQLLRSQRQRVFEVLDVLTGGFGVVYIVRQAGSSKPEEVLKTFNAGYLWSDDDRRRFEREAATWINLPPHPNVVTATSVEPIEGFPCLWMEYVAGGDLAHRLTAGPLPIADVIRLGIQFCDGMSHAYEHLGIVHRDVKPANCLLTSDGALKVTDFGLARTFAPDESTPGHVGTVVAAVDHLTTVAGTPAYMAPEQFRAGMTLDTRTDIYAFGVMLDQMLTGKLRRPTDIRSRRPWWPHRSGTIKRLTRLINGCTAARRADRPATFADVRDELSEAYNTLPGRPAPIRRPEPALETAHVLLERAVGQRHLGLNQDALTTVEQALQIVGTDDTQRGYLWQVKGLALVDLHRYAEAVAAHEESVRLNPDEFSAWVSKGAALEKLGRFTDALECYGRANEVAPGNGYGWRGRASSLLKLGRLNEALEATAEASRFIPDDEETIYFQATALERLNRLPEALDTIERLLRRAPRDALAWVTKARILQLMEAPDEARTCADRAVEVAPDRPVVLHQRALVLYYLGHHEDALTSVDRKLEVVTDDHTAWYMRGCIMSALHRPDEALASYERALALDPGYEKARTAIDLLHHNSD